MHMCCVCAEFKPLCIYSELSCALAHVLCILSPRPEVIVMDVKLRERKGREAEDHIQAGHRGQKLSQTLPCGVVSTITGPFSSRDQEKRPSVFGGQPL